MEKISFKARPLPGCTAAPGAGLVCCARCTIAPLPLETDCMRSAAAGCPAPDSALHSEAAFTPSSRTKRKKAEREGSKERTAEETDSDSDGEEGREGDADLSSEQPEDYPYIKKVTLRNFMCHEHLTVDFIPKVLPAGCSCPLPCPRTREPALIVSAI